MFPKNDPWLAPHAEAVNARAERFAGGADRLGPLDNFSLAHEYYGLHRTPDGWRFREHAPNATAIWLVGDFNAWRRVAGYELRHIPNTGDWEGFFPHDAFAHGQHYHLSMDWRGGGGWRIPAYARRVVQDHTTKLFSAQVWDNVGRVSDPSVPSLFQRRVGDPPHTIYEAHIGMAQEAPAVGTYAEFRERILPRVVRAGYNTLQLMAIMEHPYYGSFGYQVSNFFAPSSRFGTPEELKELINAAHGAGLAVIMDLVHSHAVLNENEGISNFDGTRHIYFHDGARGRHPVWDSALFDYGKTATLRFLLSNCRYWLEEFGFDGFRFDGVTSMLYAHHGIGVDFVNCAQYFDATFDPDAFTYLALANRLIASIRPDALTIAEDVSGMPGLGAAQESGGAGFSHRLAMGVTETWGALVRKTPDEHWNLAHLWHELTTRRDEERTISYLESHDQALVGGKTFFFEMADKAIYFSMHKGAADPAIDRALALHKIARLLTLATASDGYLNFIGNEFGHPEWIDFPREGNGWSYEFARRRWSLRDDPALLFKPLADFDQALIKFFAARPRDLAARPFLIREDSAKKLLIFGRGSLLIAANLHPARSHTDFSIPVPPGDWWQCLDTDAPDFAGHSRLAPWQRHHAATEIVAAEKHSRIRIYLPCRTAIVMSRKREM
ncbi:MAG: alpha amylase C-terminal domain-containing protein [Kiritimatiellaeota bacterium]|nr:alpha amylase C-terminal domain-containing protein [Kiritimatiellota bacterium]